MWIHKLWPAHHARSRDLLRTTKSVYVGGSSDEYLAKGAPPRRDHRFPRATGNVEEDELGALKREFPDMGTAAWKNSEEMKRTFNSVDYNDPRTIFNIGENNLRLIALVDFKKQLVQIADVMTHAEYDKGRWK